MRRSREERSPSLRLSCSVVALCTNAVSLVRESQRDSVTQPRVAESARLPWVHPAIAFQPQRGCSLQPSGCRVSEATLGSSGPSLPTPTGLKHVLVLIDATPLGLKRTAGSFPRVARASQPWAKRWNPLGIRDEKQQFSRIRRAPSPGGEGWGEGGPILTAHFTS